MDIHDPEQEKTFDGTLCVPDRRNADFHVELRKVDRIVSQGHAPEVPKCSGKVSCVGISQASRISNWLIDLRASRRIAIESGIVGS
jgi:hypothetical protein